MWLEALSLAADHAEKCPTCGGGVHRRPHRTMHAGSYVSDRKRVVIRKRPPADFADPVVLDPLTQYFDGGLYRLFPNDKYPSRGGRRLHRDVWQAAFGPIPVRCHIHHRDNNPWNNALANLECVPGSKHLSDAWHEQRSERDASGYRGKDGKWREHFTAMARSAAAEWHGSEEGRLWHRRHALRTKGWTKWKREPKPCEACGRTIQALVRANGRQQKYCSNTCKARAYRDRRSAE